jgi:hypothetical protein
MLDRVARIHRRVAATSGYPRPALVLVGTR